MITEPNWDEQNVGSAVPAEIRAEIGFVVILQGSIEYELRACISRMLRIHQDIVETTTAELSYKQLMSLLSSLVIGKAGKDHAEYENFAQAAGELDKFEAFRNTIAHSHWSHSLEDAASLAQAARHKSTAKRGQGLKRNVAEVTQLQLRLHLKKAVFYMGELFKAVTVMASGDA